MNKEQPSALHEKKGVTQPLNTSDTAINNVKRFRSREVNPDELAEKICNGDTIALSRAITLVESTNPEHSKKANQIITTCLPKANKSVRIGITGVPGAGKSTFIESFGKHLTSLGKKVAVLAVDPSSSISKGSILGDKTRMEDLVKDKNAFIRPSPSGNSLGGVARKTRETIILCEACGFDTIIIETVGVGQSETAVHSMVDFFLLLKISGAGDELQGIKRGIMEMADAIVINKADGDNLKPAERAKVEFKRALHLYPPKANGWIPKVLTASALYDEGVENVWKLIENFRTQTTESGHFNQKRLEQQKFWFLQTIDEQLKSNFYQNPVIKNELKEKIAAIDAMQASPFAAATDLLNLYYNL
ncbi:methylmalonyl Co-A mutase-associated GTPase MeaB [Neptunitalea lumnitzerae]|uniref:ATPase/protein kinase n=1 Tax=Neptunitalea lumnitzerae TaxID=2965509 RepID=A0ABQ5MHS5_9FLAO|nr:methylmalonyl Co-A mutase-associated GTPase MeaB [Neptunitalea sp. Y10]GLB48964.1 ATPase/protein kinase [Neptunitalea sp. Y10]